METRLTELESRVAFQEDTIQKLNDVLVDQQRQIDQLLIQVKALREQLDTMAPSLIADITEETPPPHY